MRSSQYISCHFTVTRSLESQHRLSFTIWILLHCYVNLKVALIYVRNNNSKFLLMLGFYFQMSPGRIQLIVSSKSLSPKSQELLLIQMKVVSYYESSRCCKFLLLIMIRISNDLRDMKLHLGIGPIIMLF